MKRDMNEVIRGPEVSKSTPKSSGDMKLVKLPQLNIVETCEGVRLQPLGEVKRVEEREAQPKKRPPARKFWRMARRM